MRKTQKKMKTPHKILDVWIKTQSLVLDKLLKLTGQALLFPTCNFGTKTPWLQAFRNASCLCKAAAGGIRYKNLQLGSSGSAHTNQVLWSKQWGVTVPPVWLYHDRESWLDLLPATCEMFVENLLLRCYFCLCHGDIQARLVKYLHVIYCT